MDGATFNVIDPLVREGELPNIARIMREGTYAHLDSTIPPLTPVAWPSMYTGKLSGKHGIFDFSHPTRNYDHKNRRQESKLVNSTFIKSKTLWELLGEAGKKCIVVDVPLTYPPSKINGLMISRVMSAGKTKVTYPPNLYFKLVRKKMLYSQREKDDLFQKHRSMDEKEMKKTERQLFFRKTLKGIGEKVELIEYLNNSYAWDFFMVVFMEADYAGHGYWQNQGKVKRTYQELDKAIGRVLAFLPGDSLKLIVSDHGFKGIKGDFYLDEWLFRHGYLKKTFEPEGDSKKLMNKMVKFKEDFHKKPGKHMGTFKFITAIDYKNSLASLYSRVSYGIRINLKGRDPGGVVEVSAYENLRERLIGELKNIKDPLNGELLFGQILKKEDVIGKTDDGYAACDIYFLPKNMDYLISSLDRESNRLFKKRQKMMGFHRKEGIFFACGNEFRKGFNAEKLSILDITPTILHLLDVRIPEDVDGKVRKDIFNETSESYKRGLKKRKNSQKYAKEEKLSVQEEEKTRHKLRALGYME